MSMRMSRKKRKKRKKRSKSADAFELSALFAARNS
jgi:hypothetical protein